MKIHGEEGQEESRSGALLEEAYIQMKRDIITHRLRPGQKVSEARLVRHTGLGRAPVRAAMTRLIQEGLIQALSAKTTIISPLTMAEIREMFHLRNMIEPDAARLAIGRVDVAELRRLNGFCDMEYRAGVVDEEYAFLKANRDFHMCIAEASGHPTQARWIARLQDTAMRVLWIRIRFGSPAKWARGHDEIIDAIERRDAAAVERHARKHLVANERVILSMLLETASDASLSFKFGMT